MQILLTYDGKLYKQFVKCPVMSWFSKEIFAFHAIVVIKMILKWLYTTDFNCRLRERSIETLQDSVCTNFFVHFISFQTRGIFELAHWDPSLLLYHASEIHVFAVKAFSQTENYASKLFKHSNPVIKFICKWFSFRNLHQLLLATDALFRN